jgi:UDP-N-acetylmuramoyl-L-alanyl-D-glutamate--2,6-diaminopimelate ligase
LIPLEGVTHDSRKVRPGWLFAAIPGKRVDGREYIEAALEAGASAILAQVDPPPGTSARAWIRVDDPRKALPAAAARVYGDPSLEMTLIGITGTNGKTSLTFLLEAILKEAGLKPGIIGTVNYRWGNRELAASHTTPEASELQALLREMADDGVTHVVMEVSSHGLYLNRLDQCHFDIGVFTNLSQDHLDFHPTLEDYYQAKRLLFSKGLKESQKPSKYRVLNMDDPYGRRLSEDRSDIPVIGYGSCADCGVRTLDVGLSAEGISGKVRVPRAEATFESRLVGDFNLQNILAAIAVSEALGLEQDRITEGIKSLRAIPGRLERVESYIGTILVDYAHTPEALRTALKALNSFRNGWNGRIITVMGCGGDRDKTKRPIMGREAANWSDLVVVTSDNPRTEDPSRIIEQIIEGIENQGLEEIKAQDRAAGRELKGFVVIPDRREAIQWAVDIMGDRDILLIAGKGHETYQEINGVRRPFDDRVVAREALIKRQSGEDNRDRDKYKFGAGGNGALYES